MTDLTPEQRWTMEVLLLTLPHPNQTPEQAEMVERVLNYLRANLAPETNQADL